MLGMTDPGGKGEGIEGLSLGGRGERNGVVNKMQGVCRMWKQDIEWFLSDRKDVTVIDDPPLNA